MFHFTVSRVVLLLLALHLISRLHRPLMPPPCPRSQCVIRIFGPAPLSDRAHEAAMVAIATEAGLGERVFASFQDITAPAATKDSEPVCLSGRIVSFLCGSPLPAAVWARRDTAVSIAAKMGYMHSIVSLQSLVCLSLFFLTTKHTLTHPSSTFLARRRAPPRPPDPTRLCRSLPPRGAPVDAGPAPAHVA